MKGAKASDVNRKLPCLRKSIEVLLSENGIKYQYFFTSLGQKTVLPGRIGHKR